MQKWIKLKRYPPNFGYVCINEYEVQDIKEYKRKRLVKVIFKGEEIETIYKGYFIDDKQKRK